MSHPSSQAVLKVLLHAPTPDGLTRARNNAANLSKEAPDAEIRVIVNAEAVNTALDTAHTAIDPLTWLCPITLARSQRDNRAPLQLLKGPAVLEIARLQQEGWIYIRS